MYLGSTLLNYKPLGQETCIIHLNLTYLRSTNVNYLLQRPPTHERLSDRELISVLKRTPHRDSTRNP